jgi:hypothetical protein
MTGKHWTMRYACLACSLLAVGLFMFSLAPALSSLPAVQPLSRFIDENDIDAGALYYTEIEEFSEAEVNMTHAMDYPPKRR